MNDVERILHAEFLENRYMRFYREMKKKGQELREMQGSCKHEIVVFTEHDICYSGYDDNLFQKCLFCGEESDSRRHFRGSACIDVSQAKSFLYLRREVKFEIVKKLYLKATMTHKGFSKLQLQEIVENQIANPTPEFFQIRKEVYEKYSK